MKTKKNKEIIEKLIEEADEYKKKTTDKQNEIRKLKDSLKKSENNYEEIKEKYEKELESSAKNNSLITLLEKRCKAAEERVDDSLSQQLQQEKDNNYLLNGTILNLEKQLIEKDKELSQNMELLQYEQQYGESSDYRQKIKDKDAEIQQLEKELKDYAERLYELQVENYDVNEEYEGQIENLNYETSSTPDDNFVVIDDINKTIDPTTPNRPSINNSTSAKELFHNETPPPELKVRRGYTNYVDNSFISIEEDWKTWCRSNEDVITITDHDNDPNTSKNDAVNSLNTTDDKSINAKRYITGSSRDRISTHRRDPNHTTSRNFEDRSDRTDENRNRRKYVDSKYTSSYNITNRSERRYRENYHHDKSKYAVKSREVYEISKLHSRHHTPTSGTRDGSTDRSRRGDNSYRSRNRIRRRDTSYRSSNRIRRDTSQISTNRIRRRDTSYRSSNRSRGRDASYRSNNRLRRRDTRYRSRGRDTRKTTPANRQQYEDRKYGSSNQPSRNNTNNSRGRDETRNQSSNRLTPTTSNRRYSDKRNTQNRKYERTSHPTTSVNYKETRYSRRYEDDPKRKEKNQNKYINPRQEKRENTPRENTYNRREERQSNKYRTYRKEQEQENRTQY